MHYSKITKFLTDKTSQFLILELRLEARLIRRSLKFLNLWKNAIRVKIEKKLKFVRESSGLVSKRLGAVTATIGSDRSVLFLNSHRVVGPIFKPSNV